ncbi:hypothetical protein BJ912DRAFT_932685 [Pholiota molesta]|nr:hypothetical protein BJ912DRAFT_932685 [Pholiota molesta]
MGFFYRLSLLAILLTTFASTVQGFDRSLRPPKNVARFKSRAANTSPVVKLKLTEAEAHARWLTSRKPTRRGTAQRRQTSAFRTENARRFSAQDATTGAPVGSLAFSNNTGWTISPTEEGAVITYSGTLATRDTRDAQRLVYSSPDASYPYKYFGIGQCNVGSPTDIGPGSANVLCLVNSASATRAGALPTLNKNNLDTNGSSYVESNVWTLDPSAQTAVPVWINPDGRSIPAHIVSAVNNPDIIFVTGDVGATSAFYETEFRKITLRYTNLD